MAALLSLILTASLKQCQLFLGQTGQLKKQSCPTNRSILFFKAICKKMSADRLQTLKLVLSSCNKS